MSNELPAYLQNSLLLKHHASIHSDPYVKEALAVENQDTRNIEYPSANEESYKAPGTYRNLLLVTIALLVSTGVLTPEQVEAAGPKVEEAILAAENGEDSEYLVIMEDLQQQAQQKCIVITYTEEDQTLRDLRELGLSQQDIEQCNSYLPATGPIPAGRAIYVLNPNYVLPTPTPTKHYTGLFEIATNTPEASGASTIQRSNSCEIGYTVRAGDTLSNIATRYGVPLSELISYNNISNPNNIYAGQCVLLPPRKYNNTQQQATATPIPQQNSENPNDIIGQEVGENGETIYVTRDGKRVVIATPTPFIVDQSPITATPATTNNRNGYTQEMCTQGVSVRRKVAFLNAALLEHIRKCWIDRNYENVEKIGTQLFGDALNEAAVRCGYGNNFYALNHRVIVDNRRKVIVTCNPDGTYEDSFWMRAYDVRVD